MRISASMNDYQDLMSIQNGSFTIMKQCFNLRQVLNKVVLNYDINMANSALAFDLEVADFCLLEITCDKLRLLQILSNLLSNAVKFAKSRISLYIEYLKEDGLLQVIVSDDGSGFSFEKMGYIIDRMSAPMSQEIRQHFTKH